MVKRYCYKYVTATELTVKTNMCCGGKLTHICRKNNILYHIIYIILQHFILCVKYYFQYLSVKPFYELI